METLVEREERIARLEHDRSQRRGQTIWPTLDRIGTGVVNVAPGRGDLGYASWSQTIPTALWTIGGRPVSFARLYMSQPWVAAAINHLLWWAIRVPLKVYLRQSDDPADRRRLRAGEHPLATAIQSQDGRSAAQLTMQLLGPVLVHGNSVTLVEQGARDSLLLTPKDWRFTTPMMPFRDTVDGFKFDIDNSAIGREYSVDEVLHVATWSPVGPLGISPLQQLGVTLQIEDAAQRFTRATFLNGAKPPSAVVASEQFLGLKPGERQQLLNQLRADLTQIYAGPENAGRPALLPPGLDWKPLTSSSLEAELTNQRQVNREEIAAVYNVPPPMLGDLRFATYSNIDTQHDMIYRESLGPYLVLVEDAINSQVVWRQLQEPEIFVEFDFAGVLRGDRLQEIQALREAIGTGLMTPNEGRQILNMPKSEEPGMDQFWMPTNNQQPVGAVPVQTP